MYPNQLYVPPYKKWRTGVYQKSVEFSANAFPDVYQGHVNAFQTYSRETRSRFSLS